MNADAIGYDFRIQCLQFSATFSKRTNQQTINQSKIAMALNKKYALPLTTYGVSDMGWKL